MFKFISRLRQRKYDTEEEEAFLEGFHGILENEKQRRNMSPSNLAIRLSKCDKDSPAYVLLSHELNRRIANVQSRATYVAAIAGLAGIVAGAFLGAAVQKNPTIQCNCNTEHASKIEKPIEEPSGHSPREVIPAIPKQPGIKQDR